MGYFQVRYDSGVVIYDRRGFIRLATEVLSWIPVVMSLIHLIRRFMNVIHELEHPVNPDEKIRKSTKIG